MFQFPGFALKTLCIQSISTCLCLLLIDLAADNNKHSSGLPHSEIHGSKLILSSSWLIAEYHVLHRLLLPRHSPNALFALDLIQKEQNRKVPFKLIKSHFFPALTVVRTMSFKPCGMNDGLVYLTWTTYVRFTWDMTHRPARPVLHLSARKPRPHEIAKHLWQSNIVDFVSL